ADVIETLMAMVRGGSIAVIPEKPPHQAGIAWPPKSATPSFRNVVGIDDDPYIPVAERYRAQLRRVESERTTWAECQAITDDINAGFMRNMEGLSPLLDTLFDAAGWTAKYSGSEGMDSPPLRGALPFEYSENSTALAGKIDIAGLPFNGPANAW